MNHPAIKRIAAALSWINAADIPNELIESPAYGPQERADVRAIIARVLELKRGSKNPKINHWMQAREEFIARALDEANFISPNHEQK